MKRIAKFVSFAKAGDSVYINHNERIDGYGHIGNPHAAVISDKLDIPDGTPVVNTTVPNCNVAAVYHLPMVNVDLPEGEVDRISDLDIIGTAAKVYIGTIGNLIQDQENSVGTPDYGPLDFVCISEFCRLWKVQGARVGVYKDGKPVFED